MFDQDTYNKACDEQDGMEIAACFAEPASPEMRAIAAAVRREERDEEVVPD